MFPQNIFPKKFEKNTKVDMWCQKKYIFTKSNWKSLCAIKAVNVGKLCTRILKVCKGFIYNFGFPYFFNTFFLFIIYMVYTVEKLMNNILCIAFKNGTFLIKFISFWWFMFDKHSKWFSTYSTQKCYLFLFESSESWSVSWSASI